MFVTDYSALTQESLQGWVRVEVCLYVHSNSDIGFAAGLVLRQGMYLENFGELPGIKVDVLLACLDFLEL